MLGAAREPVVSCGLWALRLSSAVPMHPDVLRDLQRRGPLERLVSLFYFIDPKQYL